MKVNNNNVKCEFLSIIQDFFSHVLQVGQGASLLLYVLVYICLLLNHLFPLFLPPFITHSICLGFSVTLISHTF